MMCGQQRLRWRIRTGSVDIMQKLKHCCRNCQRYASNHPNYSDTSTLCIAFSEHIVNPDKITGCRSFLEVINAAQTTANAPNNKSRAGWNLTVTICAPGPGESPTVEGGAWERASVSNLKY